MNQPNYFDFPNSEISIPLRKRPGLQIEKIYFQSEPSWVVKIAHDQEFHHLNEHEFAIFDKLDGSISYRELRDQFNSENSPYRVNFRELTQLLTELFKKSVIEATRNGTGAGMHVHSREKRREKLKQKFKSVFAIKWKGWDPDAYLKKSQPYVGWFFSRPMVSINIAMFALVLCWMLLHQTEFFARLPDLWSFVNPNNWLSLGIAVAGTKFVHELGHAYVHKRFGGECHEIGVMIFYLMPTMYCNTSDSWLFHDKWKRMFVGLGGIYVEMFIFSIAATVWWFGTSGYIQDFCMNLMFICSISGAITNGNPLLKYDGYYVLADYLEIPNLQGKSNKEIGRLFFHYGCGDRKKTDLWTSRYNKRIYVSYGIGAFLYRIFLMIAISWMLISSGGSFGLAYFGMVLAGISVGTCFFQPLKACYKHLKEPGSWQQMRTKNLTITACLALLVLLLLSAVPFPYWIPAECSVSVEGRQELYAAVTGRVAEVCCQPGAHVAAGDVIMKLANDQLDSELINLEMELDQAKSSIEMKFKHPDFDSRGEKTNLVELRRTKVKLENQIRNIRQRISNLNVTAPFEGVIYGISVGSKQAETRDRTLNQLYGNPLGKHNVNGMIERGTPICSIAPVASPFVASMAIEQSYSGMIKIGQPTKLIFSSNTETIRGKVTNIASIDSMVDDLPTEIAKQSTSSAVYRAGQLANPVTKKSVTYKDGQTLSSTLVQARSSIKTREGLVLGSTGSAYIHVGSRTLLQRLWHQLNNVRQQSL